MKKSFVFGLIALLLFSSLALLPAPARAAETISTNKLLGYENITYDFTSYTSNTLPDGVVVTNWVDATTKFWNHTYNLGSGVFNITVGQDDTSELWWKFAPSLNATICIKLSWDSKNATGGTTNSDFLYHITSLGGFHITLVHYGTTWGIYEESWNLDGTMSKTFINTGSGAHWINITYYGQNGTHALYVDSQLKGWFNVFGEQTPYTTYGFHGYIAMYGKPNPGYIGYVNIYKVEQLGLEKHIITPALKKLIPFGFDDTGGYEHQDIQSIINNGWEATLFITPPNGADNYTLDILKDYQSKGIDIELHTNKTVTDTYPNTADAVSFVTSQVNYVRDEFGSCLLWTSWQEKDNYTIAKQVYQNTGAIRRNGIWFRYGNFHVLEDSEFDDEIALLRQGIPLFLYTHSTDGETVPDFSVSSQNWQTFLSAIKNNGYHLTSWKKAYLTETHAYADYDKFTDIEFNARHYKFKSNVDSFVEVQNVNNFDSKYIVVKDLTTGKTLKWFKGSVIFYAEEGHTYEIYEDVVQQSVNVVWSFVPMAFSLIVVMMFVSLIGTVLKGVSRAVRH